ncbi:MAG: hypothetical protein KatS3mg027_2659 [Bacteroidia bacterium]|nr:MAG: hypothetical protein KatS3mg027_2659 [Bacteroidia bacterium]
MKVLLSLFLFAITFFAQTQEMKTYTDNETGVSINYPSTWEYRENPRTVFILIRPLEKEGQVFRENVNLIINDDQDLTLQEYTGVAKMQLRKQLQGYKELSTETVELGGKQYTRIIYQHSINNLSLQVAYYILLQNGKAYNLTCSSTQIDFEKYLPVFEKMVSSLTVRG